MSMNDSGHRTDYGNGAKRERAKGKGRYDLIPPEAMKAAALVFEAGAEKYGDRNWENGIPKDTCIDSALRHITQAQMGDESEDHMAHALTNIMMYLALREREKTAPKAGVLYISEGRFGGHCAQCVDNCTGMCLCHGWIELGYTEEGMSETVFSGPSEASMTFKLDEVSRENLSRVFNTGVTFRKEGRVHIKKVADAPMPQPVSEFGCCSQAYYSQGKVHSGSCDIEKVKQVADKHRSEPVCRVNACPNVGHPLSEDGCPADHASR